MFVPGLASNRIPFDMDPTPMITGLTVPVDGVAIATAARPSEPAMANAPAAPTLPAVRVFSVRSVPR